MGEIEFIKLESKENLGVLVTGDILKLVQTGLVSWGTRKPVSDTEKLSLYYEGHKTKELLRQSPFGNSIEIDYFDTDIIEKVDKEKVIHRKPFYRGIISPTHYLYEPRKKALVDFGLWRKQ